MSFKSQFVGFLTEVFPLAGNGHTADLQDRWSASNWFDKVLMTHSTTKAQYAVDGPSALKEIPGLPLTETWAGVNEFQGHVVLWRDNVLKYSDVNDFTTWIPISETVSFGFLQTLDDFAQPAPGGLTDAITVADAAGSETPADLLTVGQYVRIDLNVEDPATAEFNFYEVAELTSTTVRLRRLYLTGGTDEGTTISAAPALIATMPANEAGELINAGAQINGDILQFITLGEYGYIFKERSIQTVQYVGILSGTYVIRPEIVDEGLLTRYSITRLSSSHLIFLGHRELYRYAGGQGLEPVCMQHTRQLYRELDRSRVHEIVMHHHEPENEIWIVYPAFGISAPRVLVYNYVENTATIDDYPSTLGGISCIGAVDWEKATAWNQLSPLATWTDAGAAPIDATVAWRDFVDSSRARITVIGASADEASVERGEVAATPRLMAHHSNIFSQMTQSDCAPGDYECSAETVDHDFGDETAWKYVDTVQVSLEVKDSWNDEVAAPKALNLQVGARDNLDSEIRWSPATPIEASGGGPRTTKFNIRASGRFIRLRFSSTDQDIRWRVAGYKIVARVGSTF